MTSSLLKNGGTVAARPFGQPSAPIEPQLDPELLRLREENASLRRAIVEAEQKNAQAIIAARDEGAKAARDGFAKDEQQRLQALTTALTDAAKGFAGRLDRFDDGARETACAIAARLLGPENDRRDDVCAMVAAHTDRLRSESVLRLAVSPEDFAEEDLAGIDALQGFDAEVVVDPALSGGTCRFDLRIGHAELSIDDFLAAARREFLGREDMA